MLEKKPTPLVPGKLIGCLFIVGGIALVIWQFFTFMDVVQAHTAQAHSVSRSASWAGHPVGTTPQIPAAAEIRRVALQPELGAETGMMHAVAP
jgi:cytoskeletal protein RodZ